MSLDGFKNKKQKINIIGLVIYILIFLFISALIVVLMVRRNYMESGYKNEEWLISNYKEICCLFLFFPPVVTLLNLQIMEIKYKDTFEKGDKVPSLTKVFFFCFIITILYLFANSVVILSIGIPLSVFSVCLDIFFDVRYSKRLTLLDEQNKQSSN